MATTKSAVTTVTPVFTFIWQQPSLQWQQSRTSVYIYMATTKSAEAVTPVFTFTWQQPSLQWQQSHTSVYIYMATTMSAVATVTLVFTFTWQQPSLQWQQSRQCLHLHGNNQVCSGNSHTSVYIYMATTKSAVTTVTRVFTFTWQQPSLQWQQSRQCLHLHGNNQVCSGNSHTSVYIYMATTKSAVATVTLVFTFTWQQPSLQWQQSHQCLHLHGNNQVCSGNSHAPVFTFTWQQPSLQWQQSHAVKGWPDDLIQGMVQPAEAGLLPVGLSAHICQVINIKLFQTQLNCLLSSQGRITISVRT